MISVLILWWRYEQKASELRERSFNMGLLEQAMYDAQNLKGTLDKIKAMKKDVKRMKKEIKKIHIDQVELDFLWIRIFVYCCIYLCTL